MIECNVAPSPNFSTRIHAHAPPPRQTHHLLRAEDVLEEGAGDALGPAFADSTLPGGTLSMLSHLKRAREYRRRADRQQECLENEVRACGVVLRGVMAASASGSCAGAACCPV